MSENLTFGDALRALYPSRVEMWCAKIFGRKVEGRDGGAVVTTYHWRGRIYVTDFRHEES